MSYQRPPGRSRSTAQSSRKHHMAWRWVSLCASSASVSSSCSLALPSKSTSRLSACSSLVASTSTSTSHGCAARGTSSIRPSERTTAKAWLPDMISRATRAGVRRWRASATACVNEVSATMAVATGLRAGTSSSATRVTIPSVPSAPISKRSTASPSLRLRTCPSSVMTVPSASTHSSPSTRSRMVP